MHRIAVLFLLCSGLTTGPVGDNVRASESRGRACSDSAERSRTYPTLAVVPPHAESMNGSAEGEVSEIGDSIVADSGTTTRVAPTVPEVAEADSLELVAQQMLTAYNDTAAPIEVTVPRERWVPDPKKALWLAIVFPGGGQIYNRKYWKLPLFYGGFIGCLYAMNWNNTMYHDYSQAYLDIMDDDDNSVSYMNFLPSTYDVESNLSRLQSLFKKKKDYYRRYRDLSFFCLLGVYALSILDAYIDAELSSFDISRDLTMKVRPSVITDQSTAAATHLSTLQTNSYGVQCAIEF